MSRAPRSTVISLFSRTYVSTTTEERIYDRRKRIGKMMTLRETYLNNYTRTVASHRLFLLARNETFSAAFVCQRALFRKRIGLYYVAGEEEHAPPRPTDSTRSMRIERRSKSGRPIRRSFWRAFPNAAREQQRAETEQEFDRERELSRAPASRFRDLSVVSRGPRRSRS